MQIIEHNIFPTMFIIGHRIDPEDPEKKKIQKVGTVIVKGTFGNLNAPAALPKEEQMPIFVKDHPFNVVRNSDFELEKDNEKLITPWQASGGTPEAVAGGIANSTALKLSSNGGQDYLTQTLKLGASLGGRTFILSFYAKAEVQTVNISGFELQAVDSNQSICRFPASIQLAFRRFASSPGTWPTDLDANEMEVILPGSHDPANPVYFDRVQVEESSIPTRWDEDTVFRYEHDLVPFKPYADIVVLVPPKPPASVPPEGWRAIVALNSVPIFSKQYTFNSSEPPPKVTFGWTSRNESSRKGDVDWAAFDPEIMVLPQGFQNEFYNGWDRAAEGDLPLSYLQNDVVLTIHSDPPGPMDYEVRLPGTRPAAILITLTPGGSQVEQEVLLNLDSVIIEPERDRYMVVWRGIVWGVDSDASPPENYLALKVTGGV